MTRGSLTERTLTTLLLLMELPRTLREMARHFGVSTKTVSRDITALSRLLPVREDDAPHDSREARYRLSEDFEFKPPQLTVTELATLLLAQESIALTGVTAARSPFAGAARSLLAKVRAAVPVGLREQLDALSGVYGSASIPAKDFSAHGGKVERLAAAALARHRLGMRYESLTSDRTSERLFDPCAVYFDPDGATLKTVGFDHEHGEVRPFAIDRVRSLRLTDAAFERPADFSLREYLTEHCFNGIHGAPVDVTLRASGVTARVFAERSFHPSQQVVERGVGEDGEAGTTIEMRVASGRGLVRFVLSWAPDVEVLAPEELRTEVADAHRRALVRHDAATSEGTASHAPPESADRRPKNVPARGTTRRPRVR